MEKSIGLFKMDVTTEPVNCLVLSVWPGEERY